MTQELACLLIGLAMVLAGSKSHERYGKDPNAAAICWCIAVVGVWLIGKATAGYISSLPSIKEVGR